jgi:predicted Zn-dependent protease
MKTIKQASGILLLSLMTLYCSTVPITGRKQLTLIPESQMASMGEQQYSEFMKTNHVSQNHQQSEMIRSVGQKLRKALEQYYTQNNLTSISKDYNWEFNLVESKDVNAWAMPGGKVVFYTGILPLTKNDAGVAVVMGHEIAHVAARHGNERMTQSLLVQLGGMALTVALQKKPEETQKLWLSAFGLGAQVGLILPYSRLHEKEADRLGMIIMSIAGYNPNEAVDFWQRMAAMNTGAKVPEFLSTHPSDSTRIKLLKEELPEAMNYYRK